MRTLAATLLLAVALPVRAAAPGPAPAFDPAAVWDAWPGARVSPPSGTYAPEELQAEIARLQDRYPGLLRVEEQGTSAEGRPLVVLGAGDGPDTVLLWSQMHGDETTATCALMDVLSWLGRTREEPVTRRVLSRLTLLVLPMLNPDGAARVERRNAQGIDVNRDAVRLQTPEGRFLKSVRDRYRPMAGFNLHSQNPLVTAGRAGPQAALCVLAVPASADEQDEAVNPSLRLKEWLAATVARTAGLWAPGRVSRYDMAYTERAFGDSMSRWGTPTVLVETGGWQGPGEDERLVRLNFIALVAALDALASTPREARDPAGYAAIPLNQRGHLVDLLVREATVVDGRDVPPFLADLAFVRPRRFAGDSPRQGRAEVVDSGDLTHLRGLDEVSARDLVLAPAPPGGLAAWPAVVAKLAGRGLADRTGALDLDLAGLAREAAGWAGGEALVPGFAGDVLAFRAIGGRLVLRAVVHEGVWGAPPAVVP